MLRKIFNSSIILCLLVSMFSSPLFGHRGRTDAYGGHNERATGTYHFHAGPMTGQVFSSKAEAIQALGGSVTPARATRAERLSDPQGQTFVGSARSNKYHDRSCQWARKINPGNLVTFSSAEDAQAKGYVPCKVCRPTQ